MWIPQFPSTDFELFAATMEYIEDKLNNSNPNATIKEKLEVVGFNEKTAEYIQECCLTNEVYDWEPLLYWIHSYFDVQLYAPISCQEEYHQEFLKGEWRQGQWYEKAMTVGYEETDLNIQVIYVSNFREIPDMIIEGKSFDFKVKNGNIWYHGTDASNMTSIVENGIDTRCGKKKLDFSDTGFYMSQNIDMAKKWAVRRDNKLQDQKNQTRSNKTSGYYDTVFIFHVDYSKYSGVDLSSNIKEWEAAVNWYRNYIKIREYNDLYNRLEICLLYTSPSPRDS